MNKKALSIIVKQLIKESYTKNLILFENVKKIVGVIKNLPYPYSLTVLSEYAKQITNILKSKTLQIESTEVLTVNELKDLETVFMNKYSLLYTNSQVNPDLIAGVRVTAGDDVYDSTILKQINNISN